jgi:hypothetical protein
VRLQRLDTADDDLLPGRADALDGTYLDASHGQSMRQVLDRHLDHDVFAQPAQGH